MSIAVHNFPCTYFQSHVVRAPRPLKFFFFYQYQVHLTPFYDFYLVYDIKLYICIFFMRDYIQIEEDFQVENRYRYIKYTDKLTE